MLSLLNAVFPGCVAEHRFHPKRKWMFDYCWPDHGLALEVEGGGWARGRHNRGAGFHQDMEKYNEAVIAGWYVLRVTPLDMRDGRALALIDRYMQKKATP